MYELYAVNYGESKIESEDNILLAGRDALYCVVSHE